MESEEEKEDRSTQEWQIGWGWNIQFSISIPRAKTQVLLGKVQPWLTR
jgi:hypothetical protein